jgi:ATP-dependent exoDNAse (exonuclease V) beta subunit
MGYVDLVAATADRLDVLDFKTDAPPPVTVEAAYPEYVSQVNLYGRLLAGIFDARRLRLGLLFTADRQIRWVAAPAPTETAR